MKGINFCPDCKAWLLPDEPHTCHSRDKIIAQWLIEYEQLRGALEVMTVKCEMWKMRALNAESDGE